MIERGLETTPLNTQRGKKIDAITVKIILDCYENTHYATGTTNNIALEIFKEERVPDAITVKIILDCYERSLRYRHNKQYCIRNI